MLISLKRFTCYYINFEILVDTKWNHNGGALKNDHFQTLEEFVFQAEVSLLSSTNEK